MAANNIHEDIREIRGMLTDIAEKQTTTGTQLTTLLERELPALWDAAKKAGATANDAKGIAEKANTRISKQNAYAAGWAAGATGVVLAVKGYLTAKFGLHF